MSEILVNKLTGTSTAGSILVTGEGNSTTTNLQQGLAKMWLHFNHDTPAVLDSFNVASVTDVATGSYDPQYTNSMSSANYTVFRMGQAESSNTDCTQYCFNKATGSVRCYNGENGSARDLANTDASVFGDLA